MTVAVNGNTEALLKVSDGYVVLPDGTQQQQYTVQPKILQVQSMNNSEREYVNSANMQGQFMSVYADGMIPAIRRGLQKGTTMIVLIPYGEDVPTEWQVKLVTESFEDWCRILIQNTGIPSKHDTRYFGFNGSNCQPFTQGVFAP